MGDRGSGSGEQVRSYRDLRCNALLESCDNPGRRLFGLISSLAQSAPRSPPPAPRA